MDLISKRYSSPFSLLDELIVNEEFDGFVVFLMNKDAEEKSDKELWEFYLAKVYDSSFKDWKESLISQSKQNDAMNEATKEEIIKKSTSILNGFNPQQTKGGEEQ